VPDPHEILLNLCLAYGDFNRPAFLEAIRHWFVNSASPSELAELRRAIRDRANDLKHTSKKGRPIAAHDPVWIRRALQIVWQKEILHWHWRKIAAASGLKPTKDSIRTLQNRCDRYALLVWNAIPPVVSSGDHRRAFSKMLDSKPIQRLLRSRLSLPFHTHPRESRRLVQSLTARGANLAAKQLSRRPT